MKEFKLIAILCFILLLFVGLGSVSAADNGNNATVGDMVHMKNNTISDEISIEDSSLNGKVGNFENLKNEIDNLKPGDTLNLKKDYCYKINDNYDQGDNSAIKILTNNITINGNGHVISGDNKAVIFNVLGDNVTIHNITFINGKFDSSVVKSSKIITKETKERSSFGKPQGIHYKNPDIITPNLNRKHEIIDESGESAVRWSGNNGVLSDCKFIGNTAFNGGALSWRGNNGLITNCSFLNNNARGVGGALIISGTNNTVSRSIFKNSHSKYTNEVIFADLKYKNCTITDCIFDASNPIIDAKIYNVNGDNLKHEFKATIGQKDIDLIPLIYKATVKNSTIKYDNDISYSISENKTSCIFTINSKIQNGFLNCTYHFNNVNGLNDVYKKLLAKNYVKNSVITVTLNKCNEYKNIIKYKSGKGHNVLNITVNVPLSVYELYSAFNMFDEINLNNIGTFNDLAGEINNLHPEDTLNLTKNYYFNEKIDKHDIIIDTDNITINGNGYVIDGMQKHAVLKVSGNNIEICNLTFMNANNSQVNESMISWNGDNGVLSNCNLRKNIAANGGSVNWKGNNGLINQCSFINNAANVGGAVYVSGLNNRIYKSEFNNCYSELVYEAIFVECGIKNCNVSSCSFDNAIPVFDKKSLNLHINKNNAGNFDDLASEIGSLTPGDTLTLTRDYYFNQGLFNHSIIINQDNVTIDGNGHVIDEMNQSVVFNVKGNNVKICNLNFINAACHKINVISISKSDIITYDSGESLISWFGNYGVLSNCTLADNSAVNGGAVAWMGSNGLIDHCIFINNTASGVGGAIYIVEANNTIANSVFKNSYSNCTHEAIFADCKNNCNIAYCMANNKVPVIYGELSGIDVDYLHYSVSQNIAGEKVDLVRAIYNAIMYNSALKYNENINYAFVYSNNTFLFTINGKLNNGEYLINYEYYFANVTSHNNTYAWNKIFSDLLKHSTTEYNKTISVVKNVYVKNSDDYNAVIHSKKSDDVNYLSGKNIDIADADISLNVTFADKISIVTGETWKVHKSGYDIIRVNGQSSRISLAKGSEKKIWVSIDKKDFFSATKLIIDGFNCHVENEGGKGIFEEVSFKNAHNNGNFNRGFGGAILNEGYVICKNCYFYNNSAKCGGAVFNAGYFEYEDCIFENNHASKKGNDICSVDDAMEKEGDGSLTVMCSDKGIRVINGENITDTGEHWYVHVKSESLVKATIIGAVTGYVIGAVVGLVVGVCTLNPVAGIASGVAAGVAAGGAMGAYTSWYMTTNNYDPELKVWKVYATVIGISVVAGAVGGLMGGYVGASIGEVGEIACEAGTAGIESDAMSDTSLRTTESMIEILNKPCDTYFFD